MTDDKYRADAVAEARIRLAQALVATGDEDRAAFGRLYGLTSSKLFGICMRICGERQAAEDVLQEVYAIIWRRAGAYDPGRSSPITWMATIARNRAIDWRRARRHEADGTEVEAGAVADPSSSAVDRLLLAEAAPRLAECLAALDGGQAEAIRTAFFEGLTYAELAVRRAVPLGTMKSTVRRGLLKLRACLEEEADD